MEALKQEKPQNLNRLLECVNFHADSTLSGQHLIPDFSQ
jgi:hypothetical protein